MREVYVFKPDGKILLGTMKETATVVCMDNLEGVKPCPKKALELVPKEVLDFCQEKQQKFLYQNGNGDWETIK